MVKKYTRKMHIRHINLHRWFPEDDGLAAGMARLCILREDFLFELQEYLESHSTPLGDEYGPAWRQLYFFRRMCVTVKEVRNAVEEISMRKDFKQFLKEQSQDFVRDFDSFKANLSQALDTIDTVRHEASAHIKLSSIQSLCYKSSLVRQVRKRLPSFSKESVAAPSATKSKKGG